MPCGVVAYPWINTLQGAVAVQMAAERGVFDQQGQDVPPLLKTLLIGADVLEANGLMTASFQAVWPERKDDILARCKFYRRVAADVAAGLPDMIDDLSGFLERSNTFSLFRYDSARKTDPESLAKTAQWVAYLESLARVEAPILVPHLPFDPGDRILEVGGNTGITAAALLEHGVSADVLDLPAVCALGRDRRPQLVFHDGDFFHADKGLLTGSYDAVLFKSVLHDWPDDHVAVALTHAQSVIRPGGKIVICERGDFDTVEAAKGDMQALANLVFASFYRAPEWYEGRLKNLGFKVSRDTVQIDMPFHVVEGRQRV